MKATSVGTVERERERESYTLVNKSGANLVSQKNNRYSINIENSFKKHMKNVLFKAIFCV